MTTLWMSGEVQKDVADDYRRIRKQMEARINQMLQSRDYGRGVKAWDVIAIILEQDDPDFAEVALYEQNTCETEFRVRLSYPAFKAGSESEKAALICAMLHSTLLRMSEIGVRGFDWQRLGNDLQALAQEEGWAHGVSL
jgi:Immunity protein 44